MDLKVAIEEIISKPKYDYIMVFCRRGDLGELVDRQPVCMVDLNEQREGAVIPDKMLQTFLAVKMPIAKKAEMRKMINDGRQSIVIGNPVKKRIKLDKLAEVSKDLYSTVGDDVWATPLKIEPIEVEDETDFEEELFAPKVKDVRAWVGGSVTVGTNLGDDYATWEALGADDGEFTSDGTATQTSAITETGQCVLTTDLGGYTMTLDFGDFLLKNSFSGNGIFYVSSGIGRVDIKNLNFLRTADATNTVYAIFRMLDSGTRTKTCRFINCKIDGGGYSGTGIYYGNVNDTVYIYGTIISNCTRGINIGDLQAASKIENCTIHNCNVGLDAGNKACTLNNNYISDCTTCIDNNGAATGYNNYTEDATGADANWATGSGNQTNQVFADQFETGEENTITDDPALWLKLANDVVDAAGNYTPVASNLTYTDGWWYGSNGAASFNGSSSFVDCGNVNYTDNLSVMFKIKLRDIATGSTILGKYFIDNSLGINDRSWAFFIDDNKLKAIITQDGTFDTNRKEYRYLIEPINDTWYSLGMSFEGSTSTLKLYVNGKEADVSKTVDGAISSIYSSTTPVFIGARKGSTGGTAHTDCVIDDFKMFNSVLTPAQFKAQYDADEARRFYPKPILKGTAVTPTVTGFTYYNELSFSEGQEVVGAKGLAVSSGLVGRIAQDNYHYGITMGVN